MRVLNRWQGCAGFQSVPLGHPPDKPQASPHFTDEDAEAGRGGSTCPRSLGPESVQFQSPLCRTALSPGDPCFLLSLQPLASVALTLCLGSGIFCLASTCSPPCLLGLFSGSLGAAAQTCLFLPLSLRDNAIISLLPPFIRQTPRQAISKLFQGCL